MSRNHQEKGIGLAGLAGLAPDRLGFPEFVRILNYPEIIYQSEIGQNFSSISDF
jgi:hypothetical protein